MFFVIVLFLGSIFTIKTISPRPPLLQTLSGVIKDSTNLNGIVGAQVDLYCYSMDPLHFGEKYYFGTTITGTGGAYEFLNVPGPALDVYVSKEGYYPYDLSFQEIILLDPIPEMPVLRRKWLYLFDYGLVGYGDGDRVSFEIKESVYTDGRWQIDYNVLIDICYDLFNIFDVHVHIKPWDGNPANYWFLTTNDLVVHSHGDERYHANAYKSKTVIYPSYHAGEMVGISGGITNGGETGLIYLQYGSVLRFKINDYNYGSEEIYTDWVNSGQTSYGFFGIFAEDIWTNTIQYPQSAWYNAMNDFGVLFDWN